MIEIQDASMRAMSAALDGLAARQRIIAQNIANSETPGYIAGRVNFEDSLRRAVGDRRMSEFSIGTTTTNDAPGPNGNNVQLDVENVNLVDTSLRFQMMTEAMNAKFNILRVAMRRDS